MARTKKYESFGKAIKELRLGKGFGYEDAAYSIGVNRQAIEYWESGYRLPRLDFFRRMVRLYEADMNELVKLIKENEKENGK